MFIQIQIQIQIQPSISFLHPVRRRESLLRSELTAAQMTTMAMAGAAQPKFLYAVEGELSTAGSWTARRQETLLKKMADGFNSDGSPVVAGVYPIHGQTVTFTANPAYVAPSTEAGGSGGNNNNTNNNHTTREADGRIKKKTDADAEKLSEIVAALTSNAEDFITGHPTIEKLVDTLREINGQDAYSNESQALGRLHQREFLILPSDLVTPVFAPEEVGTETAIYKFSPIYVFAVYVLNKEVLENVSEDEKIKFAMIRMEAVKWGWVDNQREIRFKPTPDNLEEILAKDSEAMARLAPSAALAAWLEPFAAEHVFRTTGHHYLSGLASTYAPKYEQIFRACLASDVSKYMAHDLLYDTALHWVSPGRVWQVLEANKNEDRIPEAIRLRINSAPAGTALITTTNAVLDAMKSMKVYSRIEALGVANFTRIANLDRDIRANPPKYHKVPIAYGRNVLSEEEKMSVELAKREAEKIAPITKAFIDVMLASAPLAREQVLNKYAEMNPAVYAKCKRFFVVISRTKPANIEEALEGATREAVAGDGAA